MSDKVKTYFTKHISDFKREDEVLFPASILRIKDQVNRQIDDKLFDIKFAINHAKVAGASVRSHLQAIARLKKEHNLSREFLLATIERKTKVAHILNHFLLEKDRLVVEDVIKLFELRSEDLRKYMSYAKWLRQTEEKLDAIANLGIPGPILQGPEGEGSRYL